MGDLLKSTVSKGRNGHYHIVYVNDDGTGITSVDNDHVHDVQSDEMGNVIIIPNETHSHLAAPYEVSIPEEKRDKEEVVTEVLELFNEAKENEKISREAAKEANEFYLNRQWDLKVAKKLNDEGRSYHTVNKVKSAVDVLSGYQRQNRTDIKYLPTEDGDAIVADILNIICKNDMEQCNYPREETKVFKDMMIPGRGAFHMYMDFDRYIQGMIFVEQFPWDEVYIGPHLKEDLSDCDYLVKAKWHSLENLKGIYPEKKDEFQKEYNENASREYVGDNGKTYRLFECWQKKHKKTFILVNEIDGFKYDAEGWSQADIAKVKTIPGFYKIARNYYRMLVTKCTSTLFLEEEYIDDPDFDIIPAYAEYRDGEFSGKIEEVKDLQRLINKCYSQFTDIINKMANYVYYWDQNTFPSKKKAVAFQKKASTPGALIEVSNVDKPPKKEEGIKFPNELVSAIQMFNNDLKEIMNVHLELLGAGQTSESGVAMKQKIVQQLIGNDYLFDNLYFAKKQIGRKYIKFVQKFYTVDRIMRIISNQARKDKDLEVAGKPIGDYDPMEIQKLLETADLSRYDVDISESPYSPTAMMGSFLMLSELAGKGVPIPPDAIMMFAPIPQKDKVMKMIADAMARQKEAEDKKYDTEIKKTIISKMGDQETPDISAG